LFRFVILYSLILENSVQDEKYAEYHSKDDPYCESCEVVKAEKAGADTGKKRWYGSDQGTHVNDDDCHQGSLW